MTAQLLKQRKNNTIQILRAIAIIAVVIIHTTPPAEWQVFCRPFINYAVALFLFLSGYLTKSENNNWKTFYKKRISRVIIPYIIWSVIYSIPNIYLHNQGIERLFLNLITTKACATLYYIFVYIQFVLLTPLLCKLATSRYRFIGWIIAPISLIFPYYNLLTETEPNKYIAILWSVSCLGWFTFYYLGLVLGNKIIKKNFSLKSLTILYIISILIQMAEGYGWMLLGETNCGTQLKLSSLLTSTIFLLMSYSILTRNIQIKNKFLHALGDYSFGIYLCHIMIIMILSRFSFYTNLPFPINSVTIIFVSFGFCYMGDKILNTKMSQWIGLK